MSLQSNDGQSEDDGSCHEPDFDSWFDYDRYTRSASTDTSRNSARVTLSFQSTSSVTTALLTQTPPDTKVFKLERMNSIVMADADWFQTSTPVAELEGTDLEEWRAVRSEVDWRCFRAVLRDRLPRSFDQFRGGLYASSRASFVGKNTPEELQSNMQPVYIATNITTNIELD